LFIKETMVDFPKNYKIIVFLLGLLLIFNLFVWFFIFDGGRQAAELDFLNVGQGDASLISFPQSGKILVDAGPDRSILKSLGKVQKFFDKNIDVLILSHANLDHYAGFFEVLKHYEPRIFAYNGFDTQNQTFQNLLNLLEERKVVVVRLLAGDKIRIGRDVFKIISPSAGFNQKDLNKSSLAFQLNINNFKILFLGDAEADFIERIGDDLKSDILKVSHHGSKSGTDEILINLIAPKIALIGVGKNNPFHHPAEAVLDLLKNAGIDIFRTDEKGTIRIIFDEDLRIKTFF